MTRDWQDLQKLVDATMRGARVSYRMLSLETGVPVSSLHRALKSSEEPGDDVFDALKQWVGLSEEDRRARRQAARSENVPRESGEGGSPDGLSWLRQEFDRIYGMAIDEWHRTLRLENAVAAYRARVLEQDALAARERIAWARSESEAAAQRTAQRPAAGVEGETPAAPRGFARATGKGNG